MAATMAPIVRFAVDQSSGTAGLYAPELASFPTMLLAQ